MGVLVTSEIQRSLPSMGPQVIPQLLKSLLITAPHSTPVTDPALSLTERNRIQSIAASRSPLLLPPALQKTKNQNKQTKIQPS